MARLITPPGVLGTLSIGIMIALFSEGALMLAQLPWYALVALLGLALLGALNRVSVPSQQ